MTTPPDSMDSLLGRLVRTGGDERAAIESVLVQGTTVGRYRVERPLGRGGMGFVYLARDESLERDVALKIVAPEIDSPTAKERLLREARAAAALNHPNIVTVFDVGEQDGCVYLAMEYVAGDTLRARVGKVTWLEAMAAMLDVAEALASAHAAGVVHRDVKPDNVIVGEGGSLKVLDFGIARRLEEDTSASTTPLTRAGAVLGTPRYMAPEQIAAEAVDARADQFAWAVMAHEVVTGRPPWPDAPSLVALRDAMRNPPSLSPDLPEVVRRVLHRALSFDPSDRFDGMDEIVAALSPALDDAAHRSPKPPEFAPHGVALSAELRAIGSPTSQDAVDALCSAFSEELATHIARLGGIVESSDQSRSMATFRAGGSVTANAERAARAGLAMESTVEPLNASIQADYGVELVLHVGIATDGDQDAAIERASELATRHGVFVAAGLRKELGGAFDLIDRGDAVRVLGLATEDSRLELRSELVGRAPELDELERALRGLEAGRGRIVALLGDAGVGKSRLVSELRRGHEHLRWRVGGSDGQDPARSYAPLIGILRDVYQMRPGEAPIIGRAKLRAGLRATLGDDIEHAEAVLAHLLGVARPDAVAPPPAVLAPQLAVALGAILERLPSDEPTVVVFEDLHAADRASIDLLTSLTELPERLPLMLLVTARSEDGADFWDLLFHARRNYRHRYTELTLTPLDSSASEELVQNLLQMPDVPGRLLDPLLRRAEGNPLFVEELLRSWIEQGVLTRTPDGWTASGVAAPDVVPATVHEIVAARIRRLSPAAADLLRRASAIGRVFRQRTLEAISDGDIEPLLADLVRAELIDERSRLPEAVYAFRHAITRVVAYENIPAGDKRALHGRLAEELLESSADEVGRAAELADHLEGADQPAPALTWRLEAASRARGAAEAVSHYWGALDLLDRLERTPDRDRIRIDTVLSLLGQAGWDRDKKARTDAARHLDLAIGTAKAEGRMGELARLESLRGYLARDEEAMEEALERAEASGDALAVAEVASRLGDFIGSTGRYSAAAGHIERAVELYGQAGKPYGQAMCMVIGGRCYSARSGHLARSLEYAARGREIGERSNDQRLRAWRAMEAEPLMYLGRWQELVEIAEEALPVAWDIGARSPIMFGSAWLSIAYVTLGRTDDADRLLARAIAEAEARGIRFPLVYLKIASAKLYLHRRDHRRALDAALEAAEIAAKAYPLDRGAAFRVAAEVHAALGDDEEARRSFDRSLEVLSEIQALPELGQTHLAYGRFLSEREDGDGRAHLEQARELFHEIGADWWARQAEQALA